MNYLNKNRLNLYGCIFSALAFSLLFLLSGAWASGTNSAGLCDWRAEIFAWNATGYESMESVGAGIGETVKWKMIVSCGNCSGRKENFSAEYRIEEERASGGAGAVVKEKRVWSANGVAGKKTSDERSWTPGVSGTFRLMMNITGLSCADHSTLNDADSLLIIVRPGDREGLEGPGSDSTVSEAQGSEFNETSEVAGRDSGEEVARNTVTGTNAEGGESGSSDSQSCRSCTPCPPCTQEPGPASQSASRSQSQPLGAQKLRIISRNNSTPFGSIAFAEAEFYAGAKDPGAVRLVAYVSGPKKISVDSTGDSITKNLCEKDTAAEANLSRGDKVRFVLPVLIEKDCEAEHTEGLYALSVVLCRKIIVAENSTTKNSTAEDGAGNSMASNGTAENSTAEGKEGAGNSTAENSTADSAWIWKTYLRSAGTLNVSGRNRALCGETESAGKAGSLSGVSAFKASGSKENGESADSASGQKAAAQPKQTASAGANAKNASAQSAAKKSSSADSSLLNKMKSALLSLLGKAH